MVVLVQKPTPATEKIHTTSRKFDQSQKNKEKETQNTAHIAKRILSGVDDENHLATILG